VQAASLLIKGSIQKLLPLWRLAAIIQRTEGFAHGTLIGDERPLATTQIMADLGKL
jgi:hypothetical protein